MDKSEVFRIKNQAFNSSVSQYDVYANIIGNQINLFNDGVQ